MRILKDRKERKKQRKEQGTTMKEIIKKQTLEWNGVAGQTTGHAGGEKVR